MIKMSSLMISLSCKNKLAVKTTLSIFMSVIIHVHLNRYGLCKHIYDKFLSDCKWTVTFPPLLLLYIVLLIKIGFVFYYSRTELTHILLFSISSVINSNRTSLECCHAAQLNSFCSQRLLHGVKHCHLDYLGLYPSKITTFSFLDASNFSEFDLSFVKLTAFCFISQVVLKLIFLGFVLLQAHYTMYWYIQYTYIDWKIDLAHKGCLFVFLSQLVMCSTSSFENVLTICTTKNCPHIINPL